MTTDIIENLKTIMTTTQEEDKQYLNEVKEEIKTKRKPGRPRIYTIEEAKERVRQYDLRRYRENREKKIEMVKKCQRAKKEREKLKLEEKKIIN